MHDVARRLCLDHIQKERDHFSPYVTQDFDAYVARKRRDRTFGNHVEIQALSEIYNRPIHVYDATGDAQSPMSTFTANADGEQQSVPLRLSYHGRNHYCCVFALREWVEAAPGGRMERCRLDLRIPRPQGR